MVPLIDVMLVLLIIFMVTAPLLTHAVKVDLPQAKSQAAELKPEHIDLAIDGAGRLFWNGQPLDLAAVPARLAEAGRQSPQPELHLRADRETRYQVLATVMAEASRAGVKKIGFASDPRGQHGTP
jgi:biopolymer transport protein ExbD